MIDFSKLAIPSPEERAQEEAARIQAEQEQDAQRRRERSTKTIEILLTELTSRTTLGGDRILNLYGKNDKGQDTRAVYFYPPHASEDVINGVLRQIKEGARYRLAGYWKPREWKDGKGQTHKVFEFMAQTIGAIE